MRFFYFSLIALTLLAPTVSAGDATPSVQTSAPAAASTPVEAAAAANIRHWPGNFDQPLRRIKTPPPVMPSRAIRQEIEGAVTLDFVVDERGFVEQSTVVGAAHPLLADAAVQTVREWQFSPMTRDGQPVKFSVRQSFRFVLRD